MKKFTTIFVLLFFSFITIKSALAERIIEGHRVYNNEKCDPSNNKDIGSPELYTMSFKTGINDKSGTDAQINLFIQTECSAFKTSIDTRDQNGDLFENGSLDTLKFTLRYRGRIRAIRMTIEEKGKRPGWFSEYVTIDSKFDKIRYCFVTRKWLSSTRGGIDTGFFKDSPDQSCPR